MSKTNFDEVDETSSSRTQGSENRRKGNGRHKRFNKQGSRTMSTKDPKAIKHFGNSPDWWKKYPALMDIASKFSWRSIPGLRIYSPDRLANYYNKTGVRVDYTPSVGIALDATSPINLVFRNLWLQMHNKYRGIGRYEQADLACMCLAVAGFYADVALAERAYALCQTYNVQNRAIPTQVLRACKIDAALQASIQTNAANFRYELNMLIERAKGLLIPKGMTALYNWISLNGNIYKDGDAANAQFIAFVPTHSIRYNILTSSGSCLLLTTDNDYASYASYLDIITYLRTSLNLLLEDEDVAIMCSDLLAFYGAENVEYLQSMPEDFFIEPRKDENILLKLHNAAGTLDQCSIHNGSSKMMISKLSNAYSANVVADLPLSVTNGPDYVIYQQDNNLHAEYFLSNITESVTPTNVAAFFGAYQVYVHSKDGMVSSNQNIQFYDNAQDNLLIDIWSDNPTADEFMESSLWSVPVSRVLCLNASHSSSYPTLYVTTCATELIRRITFVSIDKTTGLPMYTPVPAAWNQSTKPGTIPGTGLDVSTTTMTGVLYLSKLDWAPLLYPVSASGTVNSTGDYILSITERYEPVGDTTNFKWIQDLDVRLVHDSALLSGFTMDATKF